MQGEDNPKSTQALSQACSAQAECIKENMAQPEMHTRRGILNIIIMLGGTLITSVRTKANEGI